MADTSEEQVPTLVEIPRATIEESYKTKLTDLLNTANLQYSLKKYNEASELYSQATELQAELNGEMAPENAEVLYLYGRCLYKVAVANSDVLGGQVAAEKKKSDEAKQAQAASSAPPKEKKLAGEIMEAAVEAKDSSNQGKEETGLANKPYFEILGDENWDTDSDDEDAEAQVDQAVEEEDDFATAYEILDIARVLLQKQIEALESAEQNGKGKAKEDMSPAVRQAKEKLADTYDLQAEISLENEKFLEAVGDSQNCAALKDTLYPQESSMVAEAHYKVSLALEFASMTAIREAQAKEGEAGAPATAEKVEVDEKMREEAAQEMEIAIASCKARLAKEKGELVGLEGEKKAEKEADIKDVGEIIEDMEQRLVDLRGPVVTVSNGPTGALEADPMSGILAQILGESPAEQKAKLEEATKNANDLSGLVRHKKKPKPSAGNGVKAETSSNGKRKLEDVDEAEGDGKKAKLEG